MILLAYDPSGPTLSSALYRDGKKLAGLHSEPGVRHSTVLVPMIGELLKKARLKLKDVDVIAVGVGPGSFTGLRVGIATAKILGYVLKKKIVGVSSLEAVARTVSAGKNIRTAVALDARKGQVYGAMYERIGDRFKMTMKPSLLDEKKFLARCAKADVTVRENETSSISGLAEGALSRIREKKFIDAFRLEPLYLHPKDCNVTLPKK